MSTIRRTISKITLVSYCTYLLNYFTLHVCIIFFITFQTSVLIYKLDVYESVHRDIIRKVINKMQLYRLIYYSKTALHISSDVFAHHQEDLTVFTVSGSNLGEHYEIL
jgi:hypothetical protein